MPPRRRRYVRDVAVFAMSLAVGLAAPSLFAAPPTLSLRVAARAFAPGELVVITMTTSAEPSRIDTAVFGQHPIAYRVAPSTWQALAGIDLDQQPGDYEVSVAAHVGGSVVRATKMLKVDARRFRERKLQVDPDFVNPPPALLTRIGQEAALVRDAVTRSSSERFWSTPFRRPVADPANSAFGTRSVYNGERRRPHAGADFLSAAGTPVHAPNAGQVVAARDLFFTGNTVIIDHGLGLVSLLAHLSSIDVREGERVSANQVVGRVGATGRVTGPHLHWALTVNGARVDPLSALASIGAGPAPR